MYCSVFWPQSKRDNHCPECKSLLIMTVNYNNELYKLKCLHCGNEYLIHELIRKEFNITFLTSEEIAERVKRITDPVLRELLSVAF